MANQSIAFHLRQNKSVERSVFFELLSKIGGGAPLSNYVYVSMGGEFLADQIIAYNQLGISTLISIEEQDWVLKRQEFNLPVSNIICERSTVTEFIGRFPEVVDKYGEGKNFIIWLDYMDPADRGIQLREVSALVPQLEHGDVVKLTMNAHVRTLGIFEGMADPDRKEARYKVLIDNLNDNWPDGFTSSDMTDEGLPRVLGAAFIHAARSGVKKRHSIVPLSAFYYADGQTMATYCAIVLQHGKEDEFFVRNELKKWPFYSDTIVTPRKIDVPLLSIREKVELDRRVGKSTAADILEELKLSLHKERTATLALIEGYREYNRFYPQYVRATF